MHVETASLPVILGVSAATPEPVVLFAVPKEGSKFGALRDDHWSANFGSCQERFRDEASKFSRLIIDFSALRWIDPLPAMAVLVLARDVGSTCLVELRLGLASDLRAPLVAFLSAHGFLDALFCLPTWVCFFDGLECSHGDAKATDVIKAKLHTTHRLLVHAESDCVAMCAFRVPPLGGTSADEVESAVQPLLREMRKKCLGPLYADEPEQIDVLLYKFHGLFTELTLNAYEHAFLGTKNPRHFAVFARLRKPGSRPLRQYSARHDEATHCPTLDRFVRPTDHAWIELFYFDSGRGLIADATSWLNPLTEKPIFPKQPTLTKVSRSLFVAPLSRHNRAHRPRLTGIQHIGRLLGGEGDFARCSVRGEWVGEMHPWSNVDTPQPTKPRTARNGKAFVPHEGTAWHFCIGVESDRRPLPSACISLTPSCINSVALRFNRISRSYGDPFDGRALGEGIPGFIRWSKEEIRRRGMWLLGAVTKAGVYQWLTAIAAAKLRRASWIVADISRVHLSSFVAILEQELWGADRWRFLDLRILFLTTECDALVVTIRDGARISSRELTEKRRADLAMAYLELKRYDSELFWAGLALQSVEGARTTAASAYLPETVVWERKKDAGGSASIVSIAGYLDLPQALVDAGRAAIARRALSRTYYLVASNRVCYASDYLVDGLLPRVARSKPAELPESKRVIVNSIRVTGHTSASFHLEGMETIYLFQHEHVQPTSYTLPLDSRASVALDWLVTDAVVPRTDGTVAYERIRGTPYVGRGGLRSHAVRRFRKPDAMNAAFSDSLSLYGESPRQMYEHFSRLHLLKLGHWSYGGQHHLLTLNLQKLVDTESIDTGPFFEWFEAQLKDLVQNNDVRVLVYVAHPVTDALINWTKARPQANRPPHVVAIHPINGSSQTAIRIPSITYERIRNTIRTLQQPSATNGETSREVNVVLLDDGAVTGRTMNEIEQLLINAGANRVSQLGIVTRTGLPLNRRTLMRDVDGGTRRYFWRWDVPPLGRAAGCVVCRLIDVAETLRHQISTRAILGATLCDHLSRWVTEWHESKVARWDRSGVSPRVLPVSRPLKFGKEWNESGAVSAEYAVQHHTATSLSAMAAEIIRVTSDKDLTLRLVDTPWGKNGENVATGATVSEWRLPRLEILLVQMLLYFDDFSEGEFVHIARRLFRLILMTPLAENTEKSDPVESLSFLCLSLLSKKGILARHVVEDIKKTLAEHRPSTGALLALGIWLRQSYRSDVECFSAFKVSDDDKSNIIRRYVGYAYYSGASQDMPPMRQAACRLIFCLGDSPDSSHVGFIRHLLIKSEAALTIDEQADLRRLMVMVLEALEVFRAHSLSRSGICAQRTFTEDADQLSKIIKLVDHGFAASQMTLRSDAWKYFLRGHDGLMWRFQKAMVASVYDVAKAVISFAPEGSGWAEFVHKKHAEQRWLSADKKVQMPIIASSANDAIETQNTRVYFPEEVRHVLKDYVSNVVHRSERYSHGSKVDMRIEVASDAKYAYVVLRNRCETTTVQRGVKHSEHHWRTTIMGECDAAIITVKGGEHIVRIPLPLTTALFSMDDPDLLSE